MAVITLHSILWELKRISAPPSNGRSRTVERFDRERHEDAQTHRLSRSNRARPFATILRAPVIQRRERIATVFF